MVESKKGGEQPSPGEQFVRTVDRHFDTVEGAGTPERTSEEGVQLLATDADGLLGIAPHSAFCYRSVKGQEDLASQFWPDTHGHRVVTQASDGSGSLQHTYFVREDGMYLRGHYEQVEFEGGMAQTIDSSDGVIKLSDEQTGRFLRWLGRAIPVRPTDPEGSAG